jgi:hypothetical protein
MVIDIFKQGSLRHKSSSILKKRSHFNTSIIFGNANGLAPTSHFLECIIRRQKSSGVWAGHYFTHSEMGLEQVAFPSAFHSCIIAFPGPSILGSVIVFPGDGHQQIWWDLSFHGYGVESFVIYVC